EGVANTDRITIGITTINQEVVPCSCDAEYLTTCKGRRGGVGYLDRGRPGADIRFGVASNDEVDGLTTIGHDQALAPNVVIEKALDIVVAHGLGRRLTRSDTSLHDRVEVF